MTPQVRHRRRVLLANAIQQTRSREGHFTVVIAKGEGVVQVSVIDEGGDAAPSAGDAELLAEGGGLFIVEAMSDQWGAENEQGGRRVWFRIG